MEVAHPSYSCLELREISVDSRMAMLHDRNYLTLPPNLQGWIPTYSIHAPLATSKCSHIGSGICTPQAESQHALQLAGTHYTLGAPAS